MTTAETLLDHYDREHLAASPLQELESFASLFGSDSTDFVSVAKAAVARKNIQNEFYASPSKLARQIAKGLRNV